MKDIFQKIRQNIMDDSMNRPMKKVGYEPLYTAGPKAKIVIIGQAPGLQAQLSKTAWHDASGITLRKWLGVTEKQFYNPNVISLLPMDFYYPGKAEHGDLPPRKGFAQKWHSLLLEQMPKIKLFILIGLYAQKHYLAKNFKTNLTQTVHAYQDYLPLYFPLVHPSPLNFRWQAKNPWFAKKVVPELTRIVAQVLG